MSDVQIYILHWAHRLKNNTYRPWNDLLFNCINSIKRSEDYEKVNNEIIVVYDCSQEFYDDLIKRLPSVSGGRISGDIISGGINIRLLEDYKKKGASGARNVAIEDAKNTFVILDNDMKVNHRWLINLMIELKLAEKYFGFPCAISYSQMPYLEEGAIKSGAWGNVVNVAEFIKWIRQYIPGMVVSNEGIVHNKKPFEGEIKISGTGVTYSGWRLSNFIANKGFVRKAQEMGAGFSSEDLSGWYGEDMEWAVRVFNTPCRLLESNTVFMQHIMGFTSGTTMNDRVNNGDILLKKLGRDVFNGIVDGSIWVKLRQDQINRYGYKKR